MRSERNKHDPPALQGRFLQCRNTEAQCFTTHFLNYFSAHTSYFSRYNVFIFRREKKKKKENKKRKLISYLPSHTLTPRRRQRMCHATPQLSRSGKIMGRVHLSSTWWQVSNKKQISGAWDAATQHTAWAISVLGAGNHQGTLNKHNSILLSSFKIQISGAEKRAGTKGIFFTCTTEKEEEGGTKDGAAATQTEIKPTSNSWILLLCQHRSLRGKGNKRNGRMQENNFCLWKKPSLVWSRKEDAWLGVWDLVMPAKPFSSAGNRGNKP